MIKATIVGGSGYTGGELLRLLLAHPEIELVQVTSRSHLGEYIYQVHPNLRKRTMLKFSDPESIQPVEQLFENPLPSQEKEGPETSQRSPTPRLLENIPSRLSKQLCPREKKPR